MEAHILLIVNLPKDCWSINKV